MVEDRDDRDVPIHCKPGAVSQDITQLLLLTVTKQGKVTTQLENSAWHVTGTTQTYHVPITYRVLFSGQDSQEQSALSVFAAKGSAQIPW